MSLHYDYGLQWNQGSHHFHKQLHASPYSLQVDSSRLKISAIKGRILWEFCSPVKKNRQKKTEPLKRYHGCQHGYFRQDNKFDLFLPYLYWPAAIFLAVPKCHICLVFHIYFCHVSTLQAEPQKTGSTWSPVQIKNSLFQADIVAMKGGRRDHLETRCSAVCPHRLPDFTHRRVRWCTLAWTGMCPEQQRCTKTHA